MADDPKHGGGRPALALEGRRFGRLLVMEQAPRPVRGGRPGSYWLTWCDCGENRVIHGASLMSGGTRSCGCLRRETTGQLRRR